MILDKTLFLKTFLMLLKLEKILHKKHGHILFMESNMNEIV